MAGVAVLRQNAQVARWGVGADAGAAVLRRRAAGLGFTVLRLGLQY
jgi:hypothetical protein